MHHPDSAGDYGSVRKVAHQTMFPTSGSNTGSGSNSLLSTAANTVVNNSPVPVDDYQPALLIQPQSPSGLSSQTHHPPHSLNLQSQPAQSAGAQMKKKSGFQITSVTSAQMSIGTNNSIAEDTESYDDLDESHTEDLSSSEILDVSLSRANDIAGAERSSSEETLNNFHDAESPGAISPNQPSHPHPMKHAAQHGGSIVNGTIHHYTHHHVTHHHSQSTAPCVTPKIFANVGAILDKVSDGSVVAHPGGGMTSASLPGMHSSVTGTTAGVVNPQSSNASNVNVPSANVFVRDAKGSSASSSSCAFPLCGISNIETGVIGNVAMGGNLIETIQQHHTMNSTIITTTMDANKAHAAAAVHSGALAGIGGQYGTDTTLSAVSYTLPQPVSTSFPVTATTSSRFRVVKLDASSEPFKKGRWTCTEYYDKDTPASAPSFSSPEVTGPAMQAGDSMQQFVPESFTGGSERESTSGSSVSSTVSTLSHYTDSVGSGEVCGVQHSQDYATPFQGFQASLFSGLNIGVSHTQSPIHPHDHTHAHLKTTVAPAALTSIHQSVSLTGIQNSMGNPISAVSQQQITYAQAVASRPSVSSQNIVMVQQQQMVYAPLPQQPPTTPLYGQAHQSLPQPTASQHLAHKPGSGPSAYGNGKDQGVGGQQQQQQQPVVSMPVQTKLQPTTSLQANASSVVLQLGVAGLGHQPPSQPIPLDRQQQQPQKPLTNQGLCNSLPSAVHSSNGASLSVPPVNPKSEPQSLSQSHNGVNSVGMSVSQCQLSCVSVAQAHTTQASVLYASLPTFSTTQLEDAQRLLLQHQSALLGLPKLAEAACGATAALGQGAEGNASAFTSSTAFFKTVDGEEDSSSGASVVAIDNKIEQAMDLVKSHLMYAVREEVEVLKEQIKELIERNSQLEQENSLLKTLASPEQMAQFQAQVQTGSPTAQAGTPGPQSLAGSAQPVSYSSGSA